MCTVTVNKYWKSMYTCAYIIGKLFPPGIISAFLILSIILTKTLNSWDLLFSDFKFVNKAYKLSSLGRLTSCWSQPISFSRFRNICVIGRCYSQSIARVWVKVSEGCVLLWSVSAGNHFTTIMFNGHLVLGNWSTVARWFLLDRRTNRTNAHSSIFVSVFL